MCIKCSYFVASETRSCDFTACTRVPAYSHIRRYKGLRKFNTFIKNREWLTIKRSSVRLDDSARIVYQQQHARNASQLI